MRGLLQFFKADPSRLLKQDLADRVRGILLALAMAEIIEVFIREAAPGWWVGRRARAAASGAFRCQAIGGSLSRSGTAELSA